MKTSPSSLARVMACAPSAVHEYPPRQTKHTDRGRMKHAVLNESLQVWDTDAIFMDVNLTDDEKYNVNEAWKFIELQRVFNKNGELPDLLLEHQVHLEGLGMVKTGEYETEHSFDVGWVTDERIAFIGDYKGGTTPHQEPDSNSQLFAYAWGLILERPEIWALDLAIIQPAIKRFPIARVSAAQIRQWGMMVKTRLNFIRTEVEPNIKQLLISDYTPGLHCTFCPHRDNCEASKNSKEERKMDKEIRTAENLGRIRSNAVEVMIPQEFKQGDPIVLISAEAVAHAQQLKAKCEALSSIDIEEEANEAGLLRQEVQKFEKDVENQRVQAKAPVVLLGKQIEAAFKEALEPLAQAKQIMTSKLEKYHNDRFQAEQARERDRLEKIRQEQAEADYRAQQALQKASEAKGKAAKEKALQEAQRQQEEAARLQAEAAQKPVETKASTAGVKVQMVDEYEILDMSKVPETYLKPREINKIMLEAAIKSKIVKSCDWITVTQKRKVGGK